MAILFGATGPKLQPYSVSANWPAPSSPLLSGSCKFALPHITLALLHHRTHTVLCVPFSRNFLLEVALV